MTEYLHPDQLEEWHIKTMIATAPGEVDKHNARLVYEYIWRHPDSAHRDEWMHRFYDAFALARMRGANT